uniref:FH2 domain containing 1 n=1 Tax=Tetraodon nigroviridis TaxID=99883 RepID=H3C3F4_TETNG
PLPPPSPPPPPRPPCPHTLTPSAMRATSTTNIRKKRRVRSFFWKPIPEEKVRGKPNIWTLAVRQQQYQIDVRSVEELFGQQEEAATGARAAAQHAATSHRVSRSRSFKESTKEEISILDSKRGMNVGIFLKQFKKSNRSIVDDIRRGEGKIYGAELLKDLLKLLPDSEEIKKLRAFKGDPDKLTLVDSFMYLLIQVPRFEVRIEAMVLREEIFPLCAVMSREIDVVRVATKELMRCEELHAILHLVLQAGNIMNAGGYAGNAVGFKLSSLLSLADTKANKPGMNLLHFVAMEAKKKDEKLLKFPEKLQDVQSAARISVENIELEFSSLYVRIKSLEEKVQEDQELQQQLEAFLQTSTQTLQELKRRRLELRKEGNALIDFFCEDKDTFKLDECFRIFQDFCIKFNKAVKDNMDRELKEAARQRRLRELEEKRFAWSGADQGGVFGRSSSENDVEMLTKECLLDFLQQRSQSPNRPLGRSASARRHRHTVNSVADRELQGYLELFGGAENPADGSRFNSLPRSGRAVQRNTTPWISAQDDNRELGCNRQLPSPRAETEPISPLARFSSSGVNDDPCNNNNIYSALSEASALHNAFFVFQKSEHLPNPSGLMNVSVERHTLVPGPQAFELRSPNNNSNHMHFVNQGDVVLTDLDGERQSPSAGLASLDDEALGREKEEDSTISSTTCDTSLPLDTAASHRRPGFCIVDCTETDCSVTLDYSEVESSSLAREGRLRTDLSKHKQDPNSLSSNLESPNDQSVSTSELSAPKSVDVACMTQSPVTDEWETESCDTAEGKPSVEEEGSGTQTAHARNHPSKMSRGRVVRTLTSSESQGMRKVVPITKMRGQEAAKATEGCEGAESRLPLRDQSTPSRGKADRARPLRHSSLPPDESKAQRGTSSKWTREPSVRKASASKPSAKPLRNIPKPAHEEKMCRSTLRALAQTSSENSSSVALSSKSPSDVPSFARNTVASSSRTKKEPGPLSVPST